FNIISAITYLIYSPINSAGILVFKMVSPLAFKSLIIRLTLACPNGFLSIATSVVVFQYIIW
ncbi:MAG: hypothetical protein ABFD07_12075, partial [Methanobacterium sp.]